MADTRRNDGFTLIELVIVMLIIAILAVIAVPGYQAFVRRGHQAGAQEFLLDVASRAQQFRADTRSYPSGLDGNAGELDMTVPDRVDDYYDVEVTPTGPPPGFIVTATPRAGTIQAGEATLTVNHTGKKTPPGVWE